MAKTEQNTATKPNVFARIGQWFARLGKGIGRGFMNMIHELKKVTWPTKTQMINYSLVVFVFMIVMIIVVGVFDLGAGALMRLITNL